MSNYLVSLIVPAYNIDKYIGRCLDSILNQTYQNIEILVVNNNSTDNTSNIIESYAKSDSRIIPLNCLEQGQSSARNMGTIQAKGEFISFVDGDDTIERDFIETLVKIQIEKNVDMVCCGATDEYANGERKIIYKYSSEQIPINEALNRYLDASNQIGWIVWAKLIRASIVKENLFPIHRIYEDTATLYKMIAQCNRLYYVSYYGYYYLHRAGSTMNSKFSKAIFDKVTTFYEMSCYFKDYNNGELYIKANDLFVAGCNACYKEAFGKKEFENEIGDMKKKLKEINGPLSEKYKISRFLMLYSPFIYIIVSRIKK